jgi:hypothetical protein
VERRHIKRQEECGFEPGKGGWKLMRTRAESLRERWEDVRGECCTVGSLFLLLFCFRLLLS